MAKKKNNGKTDNRKTDANKNITKNSSGTNASQIILDDEFVDKLAQAIVKAQQRAQSKMAETRENADSEHRTKWENCKRFWKHVWLIIINKEDSRGKYLEGLPAGVLQGFFYLIWMLCFFVAIVSLVLFFWQIYCLICEQESFNLTYLSVFLLLIIYGFFMGIVFRGAGNDLDREQDRNYIVSALSGLASFTALIVSIVTLVISHF